MSVHKVASAAITLAQQAARSDAAAREPELHRCLTDLLVHLNVWKVQCVIPAYDHPALADDVVEPTAVIGS